MPFYGKYRGKVKSNKDPLYQGRLQVSVPLVLGDNDKSWALPCVPYAGPDVGLFMLPPEGANIWVEFEGGNPDFPIWTGCFWDAESMPVKPAIPQIKVLKTEAITLKLDDRPDAGEFLLTVSPPITNEPITIKINQEGITLASNPASLKLAVDGINLNLGAQTVQISPASVSINNGALEII